MHCTGINFYDELSSDALSSKCTISNSSDGHHVSILMLHFVINVKSVRFIPNTKHGKPDIVVTALASEQIGV